MEGGEFGTFAVYDFKDDLKRQYGIAYSLMSEYLLKPDYHREKDARKALHQINVSIISKTLCP